MMHGGMSFPEQNVFREMTENNFVGNLYFSFDK